MNRYLFVMAEFNPDMIPKPQLEPLPPPKKDAEKKPRGGRNRRTRRPPEKKAEEKKAQDAERERIEKENKRKQEEYEQKIADGKKRVGELNARFADWYYVISDEVFRKIHLGHDEIFKKKEKPKESQGARQRRRTSTPVTTTATAMDEATPADKLEKMQEQGPGGKK